MLKRFQRIKHEFGTFTLFRIILMLVGLFGMTLIGFFGFSSLLAGIITIVGLIFGVLLRKQIVNGVEFYSKIIPAGLFIYGIVLFLGDRIGLERNLKLTIITVTTVIIFDLQFWSLSDPSVFAEDEE